MVADSTVDAIFATRKLKLRALADQHNGTVALSRRLGVSDSWLAQMIGLRGKKRITERTARNFEERLGLPKLWLDTPFDEEMHAHAESPTGIGVVQLDMQRLNAAIAAVETACKDAGVALATEKKAELIALIYEQGEVPQAAHLLRLVRLMR